MSIIVGIVNKQNFEEVFHPENLVSGVLQYCQVLEFRGDTFSKTEEVAYMERMQGAVQNFSGRKINILYTQRLIQDGGECKEPSFKRIERWERCLNEGWSDWMDVELECLPEIPHSFLNEVKNCGVKLLVSHHNFRSGYSMREYVEKTEIIQTFEPDIIKIVVTLTKEKELLSLFEFSQKLAKSYPLSCVMSMGRWGGLSRLGSPIVGAPIVYGFLGKTPVVAGQLSAEKLYTALQDLETQKTRIGMGEELLEYLKAYLEGKHFF